MVRGVDTKNVLDVEKVRRDVRPLIERAWNKLVTGKSGYYVVLGCMGFMIIVPALVLPIFLFIIILLIGKTNTISRQTMPLRAPKETQAIDYGDPYPGRINFKMADGWFYIGNEKDTGLQLFLSGPDLLAHTLVFGTTGAGKTEFLTGWGANSVSVGSGLIYVDAKGTSALAAQIYMLARMFGRDDDFLLLNFVTGGKAVSKKSAVRKSNTLNPLSTGTPEALYSLLSAFIPDTNGENAIFAQKAMAFINALLRPLVYLRDHNAIRLSVRTLRQHMSLEKVMWLAGYPKKEKVYGIDLPYDGVVESIQFYLSSSVAGFNKNKPASEQEPDTVRYHDFSQNYFANPLSFMTETYGFVYDCLEGEVDYEDVVYRRRILTVLLPAIEKSPAELKQLGGLILTGIRNVMGLGIGDKYEGQSFDMLNKLPTRTDIPTLCIIDEVGYIIVEGFAVTAAQARGLGTACVYAGQDYAGLTRGSEVEAEQIAANTRSKFFMSLEDAQKTWNLIQELSGKDYVATVDSYTIPEDRSTKTYMPDRGVNIAEQSRVDILDLKGQIEGEFHLLFRDKLVRGDAFYAALEPKKKNILVRINRFLEVINPTPEDVETKYGFILELRDKFYNIQEVAVSEDLDSSLKGFCDVRVWDNDSLVHIASIITGRVFYPQRIDEEYAEESGDDEGKLIDAAQAASHTYFIDKNTDNEDNGSDIKENNENYNKEVEVQEEWDHRKDLFLSIDSYSLGDGEAIQEDGDDDSKDQDEVEAIEVAGSGGADEERKTRVKELWGGVQDPSKTSKQRIMEKIKARARTRDE